MSYIPVSRYGRIVSVCIYLASHCAFINYTDHTAPGKAMKALQGKLIGGKNILIKFPDSAASQISKRTKAV
jgi:RNA recognition motif.